MGSTGTTRRMGFWGRLILTFLPARTRRVWALVSLYALLLKEEPSVPQLTALNSSLNLADNVAGLQLPARIPHLLWKNVEDIQTAVDVTDKETVILARISPWLAYGSKLDIASDVRTLLQFVETRRSGVAVVHTANLKVVASSNS